MIQQITIIHAGRQLFNEEQIQTSVVKNSGIINVFNIFL